ncbi:MAG: hypothetical protein U0075_25525 [Thermomicrobiales bacterium]
MVTSSAMLAAVSATRSIRHGKKRCGCAGTPPLAGMANSARASHAWPQARPEDQARPGLPLPVRPMADREGRVDSPVKEAATAELRGASKRNTTVRHHDAVMCTTNAASRRVPVIVTMRIGLLSGIGPPQQRPSEPARPRAHANSTTHLKSDPGHASRHNRESAPFLSGIPGS